MLSKNNIFRFINRILKCLPTSWKVFTEPAITKYSEGGQVDIREVISYYKNFILSAIFNCNCFLDNYIL